MFGTEGEPFQFPGTIFLPRQSLGGPYFHPVGWIYLTTILDLFSRKIVGWKISDRIDAKLAAEALQMAIALRQPKPGLIIHTDRGSQVCSETFQNLISDMTSCPA